MPATPNPRPFRYEWDGTLRRLALPPTVKLIAAYASQYADNDGQDVKPGVERLALETGFGEKTIRRGLALLRDLGLLVRVRSGSRHGRRGLADEYRLAIPADILDRVDLVEPIAVPTPGNRDAKPVDNPSQEQQITGHQMTADRTGTPVTSDRRSARTPVTDVPEHRSPDDRPPTKTTPVTTPTPTNQLTHKTATHAAREPASPVDNHVLPSDRRANADRGEHPRVDEPPVQTGAVTFLAADQPTTPGSGDTARSQAKPRASPGVCPHGRPIRRRRDGTPRCPNCRQEQAA